MLNNPIRSLSIPALLTAAVLASSPGQAAEQKNVVFVLDASNSMWGQIDGTPKIEIAKAVLKDLATKMSPHAQMGLIAYGHRFDRALNECDDIELLNPVGHFSAAEADNAFSFITPKGQTPIANTLRETAGWLEQQKGQDTTVVLISDGLESCDGDPCAAAQALNDNGVTTRIHVVGFDLSEAQRAKLQCISDNGNGQMFAASNAADMTEALQTVQEELVAEAPAPVEEEPAPAPTVEVVFEDQFEASFLDENWNVLNPDVNRYITEGGELLIIGTPPAQTPLDEDMTNIFTRSDVLPTGDWQVEVKLQLDIQHGEEVFYLGAMDDAENWLAVGIDTRFESGFVALRAFITKVEAGDVSRFDDEIERATDTDYAHSTSRWQHHGLGEKYGAEPFVLTLSKTGREYAMSGTYGSEGSETYKSFATENLRMLRGKQNLFLAFGLGAHFDRNQGEGAAMVDHVIVRAVK